MTDLPDLSRLARSTAVTTARGPVALVIAEDAVALPETVAHLADRGFRLILVAVPDGLDLVTDRPDVLTLRAATRGPGTVSAIVNATVAALPAGTWLHYCFNGEFLFHPYAETRRVGEMLAFHQSERRRAMATVVVDLYPRDLGTHADGIDLDAPAFDRFGHWSETRATPGDPPDERQVSIRGGLRWRMEAMIPPGERRLDRYGLVRTAPGLTLDEDHLWSDPELNTLNCPWHRNLTAALVSFRAARALMANPGSRQHLTSFDWPGATTFDWSSHQLLEAGFMETGQWV